MKKFLFGILFFGGIIAIIGIIYLMLFPSTMFMFKANDYVNAILYDDFANADTYVTENYRRNTDYKEFLKYLNDNEIFYFGDVEWLDHYIEGNTGYLEGLLVRNFSFDVRLKFTFEKVNREWLIDAVVFQGPKGEKLEEVDREKYENNSSDESSNNTEYTENTETNETNIESGAHTISTGPELQEVTDLIFNTMLVLSQAVSSGNANEFWDMLSQYMKDQYNLRSIMHQYKELKTRNLDLSLFETVEPTYITDPMVGEHGTLFFDALYYNTGYYIDVDGSYIKEDGEWKLYELKLEFTPESEF